VGLISQASEAFHATTATKPLFLPNNFEQYICVSTVWEHISRSWQSEDFSANNTTHQKYNRIRSDSPFYI